jgi:methyl-accepting chemotaxis protein
VTQAIAQMEKVTQSWAATAEECAAASEELSAQAQMALSSVGRLETQVVGHPRVLAGAAAPAAGPAHRGTAVTVVSRSRRRRSRRGCCRSTRPRKPAHSPGSDRPHTLKKLDRLTITLQEPDAVCATRTRGGRTVQTVWARRARGRTWPKR